MAEELHLAAVHIAQAQQRFEQRRLAHAVAAQQAHDLAGQQLPVELVEYRLAAVGKIQAAHSDRGGRLRNLAVQGNPVAIGVAGLHGEHVHRGSS